MSDHYDVLGVANTASFDQIKRAYYRKARALHPDAHAGSSIDVLDEAERAMAALNEAWNTLRDPDQRDAYDRAQAERRERLLVVNGRTTTAHTATRRRRSAPALTVGRGFRYFMGSSAVVHREGDTRTRLNLAVEGADLAPLRRLAPSGLWGLHCEGSQVADSQLQHLTPITSLTYLDLSGTRVTDAGLLHLLPLENLESLFLWDTAITDAALTIVGRIPSLRHLGLGNTRVTDAGLAHISGLTELRLLQLWGTDVRGPGLAHLHGMRDLDFVTLPRRVRATHRRRLRAAAPAVLID